MSDDAVEFEGEIPLLTPIQVVGGGIRIEPNENLDSDEIVVTFEAVAMVPAPQGLQLGLLPMLMETSVWDLLIESLVDNRPEEDTNEPE